MFAWDSENNAEALQHVLHMKYRSIKEVFYIFYSQDTAESCGVNAMPTFMLYKNGAKVGLILVMFM